MSSVCAKLDQVYFLGILSHRLSYPVAPISPKWFILYLLSARHHAGPRGCSACPSCPLLQPSQPAPGPASPHPPSLACSAPFHSHFTNISWPSVSQALAGSSRFSSESQSSLLLRSSLFCSETGTSTIEKFYLKILRSPEKRAKSTHRIRGVAQW